jgi:hypothetical protein
MKMAKDEPNTEFELMRKKSFDSIIEKFNSISNDAQKVLDEIKDPEALFEVQLSFTNPVDVLTIKVVTPDEVLKSAFDAE